MCFSQGPLRLHPLPEGSRSARSASTASETRAGPTPGGAAARRGGSGAAREGESQGSREPTLGGAETKRGGPRGVRHRPARPWVSPFLGAVMLGAAWQGGNEEPRG